MKTNKRFLLAASLALALAFTISCSSSDDDDEGGGRRRGGSGGGGGGGSVVYGEPLTYNGKTYKTVEIGTQTWMAENLDYRVAGSKCYNNSTANCTQYGSLYEWATAKNVCPYGWRLPSDNDWETLENYVQTGGSASIAGKYLKAKSGWNETGNGTDKYGFTALPGGKCDEDGRFSNVGNDGNWWSTSERNVISAYYWHARYNEDYIYKNSSGKYDMYNVRCLKN